MIYLTEFAQCSNRYGGGLKFHGSLLNIFAQVLSIYLFSGVMIMEELSDIN